MIIRPIDTALLKMVVMITCSHCGHEYQSKVLQTPDEETLISEPRESIMENCPNAIKFQVIMEQTFIGLIHGN
jgi:hypothetical protein